MDTAPSATSISGMFAQLDKHLAQKERSEAFKILAELRVACRGSEADELKIAVGFGRIGEWSAAWEIRRNVAAKHPDDLSLELDVFEAKIRARREGDQDIFALDAIMSSRNADAPCWDRAAHLYSEMGAGRKAVKAIKQCLKLSNDDPKYMPFYLHSLVNLRRSWIVRFKLPALLKRPNVKPSLLREFGEVALRIRHRRLALKFAERQYLSDDKGVYPTIFLAKYLHLAKSDGRARELLTGLWDAHGKRPNMSYDHWFLTAKELYEVGCIKLAKEAAVQLLARKPGNSGDVEKLLAAIKYLEERGAGDTLHNSSAGRKGGLLSWLGLGD